MRPLTPKQTAILDYINAYWQTNNCSPAFESIRKHFGFASPNAVTKHLQALIQKGHMRGREGLRPREHRSITPIRHSSEGIPILGTIAAGMPLEAIENIEERIDLTPVGFENARGDLFILKVKGESMIEAHILNGDMVIIKQQSTVASNEIAAVLWNGETTLKYVKWSGKNIILKPANSKMEPMVVKPDETESFSILGKYVGLLRKF